MRDWRVGLKLAAVLAIPLASFLVIAGVQVGGAIGGASNLEVFAARVSLGRQITALVHEVQHERDRTSGMLAALGSPAAPIRAVGDLSPDWTAVDRAAAALRDAVPSLLDDPSFSAAYARAEALLAQLPQIREGAAKGWLRSSAAFDTYTRAIAGLLALLPAPLEAGGDPEAARAVRSFANLAHAKELTAQIRGWLYLVSSAGAFQPGTIDHIADVRAQAQSALDRFRTDASAAQAALLDDVVTGQAVSNANRLMRTIIGNVRAAELGVDAGQWWLASTTQLELLRGVEQGLFEQATAGVQAASGQQWRTTMLGTLATLVLLAVAVFASVVIGRSMAAALRALREQALDVAQHSLPGVIEQLRVSPTSPPRLRVDAIVVNSHDEVGEVAAAFTAVHRSAVRLAAEQAHMRRNVNEIFIKLARRSQTLVERQLKLLDTMESKETDPAQLANLFRLDHLATRLRRNDENLLVLAEGDTTRRWDQPVELGTVMLAATAEIEHYTRIRSEIAETVHIVGYAVTDLVHLTAELLENATQFSPPTTNVTITVAERTAGESGCEIVIADTGIGMAPEAITEANNQLAHPMSIDVSAAERMGLVVVGHLAKRHGIGVTLSSSGTGTTVTISVPDRLVTQAPADKPEQVTIEPARYLTADPDGVTSIEPAGFMRSEDVLRPSRPSRSNAARDDSVWWSKTTNQGAAGRGDTPAERTGPQELTSSGLPKRVRTNQRVTVEIIDEDYHSPAEEVDPEQTGSMLTSLLSGVRRADSEPTQG